MRRRHGSRLQLLTAGFILLALSAWSAPKAESNAALTLFILFGALGLGLLGSGIFPHTATGRVGKWIVLRCLLLVLGVILPLALLYYAASDVNAPERATAFDRLVVTNSSDILR